MTHPLHGYSRRQVLRVGALAAGATSAALRLPAPARAASTPTDADFWSQVRAQFAFSEDRVPMNAANLCPSFRAVAETVEHMTYDIDADCSFANRAKYDGLLEDTRARVARQLGVSADEVALVRNTSEANCIVNAGLDLSAGDEVLIWDQNHPTNEVAWEVRAERSGFRVSRVSTPPRPESPEELLQAFTSRFTDATRVLAITHVSNLSGIKLPVREIVAAARARDIYVHVDGAQTWGAMQLDLRALDVDSYSASAHKWYMGPKEVGLLYVAQRNIDRIWPSIVAPSWGQDAEPDPVGARKFESLGQRDDAALAALGTAARIHDEIGLARTEARIVELAQRLKSAVADAGHELTTPMNPTLSHGVCIIRVPGDDASRLVDRLYEEHGLAGAPTGGLRLCPTIYNTFAHVDRAVAAVRALLG